jgi:hypothetical protein
MIPPVNGTPNRTTTLSSSVITVSSRLPWKQRVLRSRLPNSKRQSIFFLGLIDDGANAGSNRQIQNIIHSAGSTKGIPIGVLTSENRDIWTEAGLSFFCLFPFSLLASFQKARDNLTQEAINAKALERIESAVIVICLDDTSPTSRDELSWAAWTGDGRNRFYDKHQRQFSFFV